MRTFCEHFLCDGVHLGDSRGVCVLLESEPVLDSAHGPNALVMRRSGVQIPEAAPFSLAEAVLITPPETIRNLAHHSEWVERLGAAGIHCLLYTPPSPRD